MQNKQAIQLIEKIQKQISSKKHDFSSIIEDLKKVREITMDMNNPVLTKALRLSFEHLEENKAFLIEIPLSTAVAIQNRIKNIRILFFFFRVIYNTALLKEPIFLPPCFIIFRNFHNKYFKLCVSHFIYLR